MDEETGAGGPSDARPVVELIIRGVGGETAEEILGGPVYQVSGDKHAAFYRSHPPTDPVPGKATREAYEWGRLTSGSSNSGLWWLLLPFSLLNLSGWLVPGKRNRTRGVTTWARAVVTVGGCVLTGLYVLWLSIIAVGTVAVACGEEPSLHPFGERVVTEGTLVLGGGGGPSNEASGDLAFAPGDCADRAGFSILKGFGRHPHWHIAAGLSVAAIAWFFLLGVLKRTSHGEGYEPSAGLRRLSVARPDGRFRRQLALRDQDFWYHWKEYRYLWRVHLLVTAGALGVAGVVAVRAAQATDGWRPPTGVTMWVPVAIFFGILLLGFSAVASESVAPDADKQSVVRPKRLRSWVAGAVYATAAAGPWVLTVGLPKIVDQIARWGDSDVVRGATFLWRRVHAEFSGPLLDAQVGYAPLSESVGAAYGSLLVHAVIGMVLIGLLMTPGVFLREKWYVPLATSVLAVFLVGAGFSSFNFLVGRAVVGGDRFAALGVDNATPEGLILALLIAGAYSWYRFLGIPQSPEESQVEVDYGLPPPPASGGSERLSKWVRSVRKARRFARLGRRAHRFLTIWAVLAFVLLVTLGVSDGGPGAWLHAGAAGAIALFLFPGVSTVRLLTSKLGHRRSIGKVWDVISFWPRRFHPFAAPCYAERAVPELRQRLEELTRLGHGVVLSCHSQGSVIGFATLAQVIGQGDIVEVEDGELVALVGEAVSDGDPVPRVGVTHLRQGLDLGGFEPVALARLAFATYGSPLGDLYGPLFPSHFGASGLFDGMRDQLSERWLNFYRPTDYIGKRIFVLPGGALPDGYEDPDVIPPADHPDRRLLEAIRLPAGTPAPMFPFESHSNYAREPLLNVWIADMAVELSEPD